MHVVQQKLLKLVKGYNLGTMSYREIAQIIGERHPQLIKHHLEQLEKKSLIDWDRESKIITIANSGVTINLDFSIIPVLGSASCGPAEMYADESIIGHIKVSSKLLGNRHKVFAIKAKGHSMNNADISGCAIEDGDYVIIDPFDKNIKSHDYVLSVIDEVANIKKIIIDKVHSQIALVSESTFQYPEIFISEEEAERFVINGKVVQVIKQLKY